MRILVVEDSARVADTVQGALRARGHAVVVAGCVAEADRAFEAQPFDAAVVDVGLPDGSGLEWCRSARRNGGELPILLLTARNGVTDRVAGLDAGADDYLGKPFSIDELVARVLAISRRGPRWTEAVRHYGALVIDRERRTVAVGDVRVPLTAREHDIVALLAWRDGRVVPRAEVLESIWGEASAGAAASFDVLVARIRRKLTEHGIRDALRTARQVGYAWALERSKRA
ncbi:MAG: response regulator transcription factor [Polyangiaceae bacterium]